MVHPYIEKLNTRGSVLGLDNIKSLLRRLGNPQDRIPVIHVAGTNGKGSTIAFMESMFMEAGFSVGKYTSPTISSYYERFQINRENISEREFEMLLDRVKQAADAMEQEEQLYPTAFEVETAVAFLYFQRTDLMLLETGMGGRLDSTNVVERPLVTVLASISMDHMQFLGDTLEQIAREKAGILREGVPCISNPANRRVEAVLREQCEGLKAPYVVPEHFSVDQADAAHTEFTFRGEKYDIYMPGSYQVENCVTAMTAVKEAVREWSRRLEAGQLCDRGISADRLSGLSDDALIARGIAKCRWPVRMEQVSGQPDIYLDGAHNIDACERLRESVEMLFAGRPMIFIIGVLKDKEYGKMMAVMAPLAKEIITVTPDSPRALDRECLAGECGKYCDNVSCAKDLGQAVVLAEKTAEKYRNPVILAFGSLSYLGELKQWIKNKIG